MKNWFKAALALIALSAGAAYAALPGAHRALTPALFNVPSIEDSIYTDAPERREEFLTLLKEARSRSEAFFGPLQRSPRIIFCTTERCADTFGLKPLGITYGRHLILLGPKGVNEMILTHELAHVQLHSSLGVQDIFTPRIPAWFNEGLASYLANDPRLTTYEPSEARWITQAQSFRDWGRLHQEHAWQDTYGAAKSLVVDIHARIGDDGLRELIASALHNGDFEIGLVNTLGGDWP